MFAKRCLFFCLVSIIASAGWAGDEALLRIDRMADDDRNHLINSGVPLVAEMNDCFLALGDEPNVLSTINRLGYESAVLDYPTGNMQYALAGLIHQDRVDTLSACGEIVAQGAQWYLLRGSSFESSACIESPSFMLRVLPMRTLKPTQPPPERYQDLQTGGRQPSVIDPLIQDMVTNLTDDVAMDHWQPIVEVAPTRYSYAQGCVDASTMVFNLFDGLGLSPYYHTYSGSYPPNVVGTLTGMVRPSEVVIVIGHLDSTNNSGDPMVSAPGADDNASGSAMVTALAEAMSCYEFEETIKFLTVTGEEQGLYGSSGYAEDAAAANEDIQAVLNGDMISWEGYDNPEDLDVNTNSTSVWLGNLMELQSTTYNTGVPVRAYSCPNMTYSDHAPFWSEGWSAICGITDNNNWCDGDGTFYPYYHTSNDTIPNCGPGAKAFLAGNMRTYLATAADIAVPIAAKTSTPTSLTAQSNGDNRIDLSWATSGSGYSHEVYRAPGGCSDPGPATILGTVATTTFTDSAASGQMTYGYWVRSLHSGGICASAPTACIEASTTGICTEPPVFAGLDTVTNQAGTLCGLELSWSANPVLYCGASATYTIYRSIDPAFVPAPANRIAEDVAGTTYLDTDALVSGEQYYYVVRAVDTSNDIEDFNLNRVSGTPTGPVTTGTWTDDAGDTGDAQLSLGAPWSIRTDSTHSGPNAYGTGPYGNNVCANLTTPSLHLNAGSQLSFWSSYEIEADYDKGVVQISTDGGTTWEKVPVNYPDYVGATGDACSLPSGDYFANDPLVGWASYTADLDAWDGEDVLIRWRLSTDGYVTNQGWWIDDIEITNVGVPGDCTSVVDADIFTDGFEAGNSSAWSGTVQ